MWKLISLVLLVIVLVLVFAEDRDEIGNRVRQGGMRYRETLLLRCAGNGRTQAVKMLLRLGAETDARDEHGCPPLSRAAFGGHRGTVRVLLAAGAEPDARDRWDNTALIWAADGGCAETARILVAAGADPGLENIFGWTAREMALYRGGEGILPLLPDPDDVFGED